MERIMLRFVPRFMDRDIDVTPEMMIKRLIAVTPHDFDTLIHQWPKWVANPPDDDDPEAYDALSVCAKDPITGKPRVLFGAYRNFLLRPHLVMFGGASEGTDPAVAKIVLEQANRLGYLAAIHGFNLRYGGGLTGLMGQTLQGFLRGQADLKRAGRRWPHQYSLQVMSGYFLNGVSQNGFKAPNANEKMCAEADAAIVVPGKLSKRKSVMREHAAALCLLYGAIGSPDELYDAVTLVKIGASKQPVYMCDPYLPDPLCFGKPRRHYEDLFRYNERVMLRGMVSREQNDGFIVRCLTPDAMVDRLLADMAAKGQTPQTLYEQNCLRFLEPEAPRDAFFRDQPLPDLALGCAAR
jgi:predicted Rossmann-fold nucleotide-binding protein